MIRTDSHAPPDAPRQKVKVRKVTPVSQAAVAELAGELSERDEDGYGLFVALFGSEKSFDSGGDAWLQPELRRFAAGEAGALEMVIIRLGDSAEHVYVGHDVTEAVDELLRQWNIDRAVAKKRRYERLGVAKLENLFKL
jgi:hypothetical protein